MAGRLGPFFLTGANAKIVVNGQTMAFATDISYSIRIKHVAPKILGMYESYFVEPLAYEVVGSFTIVRYVKNAKTRLKGGSPNNTNEVGNGLGNWTRASTKDSKGLSFDVRHFGGNDGKASDNLNPITFEKGFMFNIDIYQKGANPPDVDKTGWGYLKRGFGAVNSWFNAASDVPNDMLHVATIRDCRITQADFNLAARSPAVQRFQFMALYVDEDSFEALFSGKGQQHTV